jgi:uncharacterized protein YegL
MNTNFIKVKDGLFLVAQRPAQQKVIKQVEVNTHHIFIIDCSGSMYSALNAIRRDMCNKLSTLLKQGDSVTLMWFSSRREYGVILEDYRINGAVNIEKARQIINQHLVARGLTAFVDPLVEAKQLIDRVNTSSKDMLHSLFFLTDGCDNQYSQSDIIKAVAALKDRVNSATMVEYGWYCNKPLMVKMATEFGGTHQHSKDFQDYEPLVQRQFTQRTMSKRSYMELQAKTQEETAFTMDNGVISVHKIEKGGVFMPVDDATVLFYFTDRVDGAGDYYDVPANQLSVEYVGGLYAAMNIASKNLDVDRMSDLLKYVGDARLISQSANTFGTQKITELENEFEQAAVNESLRYSLGYDPKLAPKEDAYCFMDMIDDLMSDDENKWYPRHEWFSYERTGKKMVSAAENLNEGEKKKLAEANATGDVKKIKAAMDEIMSGKTEELEFLHAEENPASPFSRLVWHSRRANLSVQVTYAGHVEVPDNKFGIPKQFQTVIVRNYTLVKDGIIHTYVLPVSLSEATFYKMQGAGLLVGETYESGKVYKLDFSSLPVVNRVMVKERPSAEDLCRKTHELTSIQGYTAVMNYFRKKHHTFASKGFSELYGADGAEWLKEMGLMPYGYSPKKVAEKTGEEQSVPALEVKMLKASLPSGKTEIEKVIAKMQKGVALSPREQWFEQAIRDYNDFARLTSGISDSVAMEWIDQKFKTFDAKRRTLISEIAKVKFMITVGKLWFREFKSRAEKALTLNVHGTDVNFELDDSEEIVKL